MKKAFLPFLFFLLAASFVKAQSTDLIDIDCSKLNADYTLVIKAPDGSKVSAGKNSISISDSKQFQVEVYKLKELNREEDKKAVTRSETLPFKKIEQEDNNGFIYEALSDKTSTWHFHFYAVFKTGTYLITDHAGSSYPLEKIKQMVELLKMASEK